MSIFSMARKRQDRNQQMWQPSYIRTSFFLTFVLIYIFMIIALELLIRASRHWGGIVNSHERFHYLWTYGPTASMLVAAWSDLG